MRVIAVPNRAYPPAADALALADVVLDSIGALTPELVAGGDAVSHDVTRAAILSSTGPGPPGTCPRLRGGGSRARSSRRRVWPSPSALSTTSCSPRSGMPSAGIPASAGADDLPNGIRESEDVAQEPRASSSMMSHALCCSNPPPLIRCAHGDEDPPAHPQCRLRQRDAKPVGPHHARRSAGSSTRPRPARSARRTRGRRARRTSTRPWLDLTPCSASAPASSGPALGEAHVHRFAGLLADAAAHGRGDGELVPPVAEGHERAPEPRRRRRPTQARPCVPKNSGDSGQIT